MRRLLLAIALGMLAAAMLWGEEKRTYHRVAIADMATTRWTHAQVEGVVAYVKREGDGDVHVRVCDGGACVVCEVVPYRPMRTMRVGERVRVFGITRFDKAHGWSELHPVEDVQLVAAAR